MRIEVNKMYKVTIRLQKFRKPLMLFMTKEQYDELLATIKTSESIVVFHQIVFKKDDIQLITIEEKK